jgi:hypothetical protein
MWRADLNREMSKYDDLKYWAKVKARVTHRCEKCEAIINNGDFYYKEKIDSVNPPPGFALGELCEKCGAATKRTPLR